MGSGELEVKFFIYMFLLHLRKNKTKKKVRVVNLCDPGQSRSASSSIGKNLIESEWTLERGNQREQYEHNTNIVIDLHPLIACIACTPISEIM